VSDQCGADVVDYVKFDTGKAYSRDDAKCPFLATPFVARDGKEKGRRALELSVNLTALVSSRTTKYTIIDVKCHLQVSDKDRRKTTSKIEVA